MTGTFLLFKTEGRGGRGAQPESNAKVVPTSHFPCISRSPSRNISAAPAIFFNSPARNRNDR